MSTISGFSQRFVPDPEFQADMSRLPVDDSCVISVPFSDREELAQWQQEQNERFDSEPPVDFDEAFGAQVQQHAPGEDRASPVIQPANWSDKLLIDLIALADAAGDESIVDAASAVLLARMDAGNGTVGTIDVQIERLDAEIEHLEAERDALQAVRSKRQASGLLNMAEYAASVCGFQGNPAA